MQYNNSFLIWIIDLMTSRCISYQYYLLAYKYKMSIKIMSHLKSYSCEIKMILNSQNEFFISSKIYKYIKNVKLIHFSARRKT